MPEAADTLRPARFLGARNGLSGILQVPGDKSVSHRAVLLGAVNAGPVRISGFLRSSDTLASLRAVQSLGVQVDEQENNLVVRGKGWEGLREPEDVIDVANAGTLIRLLPGLLASTPHLCILTGDDSIRRRPMARILEPLRAMGAQVAGRRNGTLPPIVVGGAALSGITYELPIASAQVKSCIVLAGLRATGRTEIIEPAASRDHTERMVRFGGGQVERETLPNGRGRITVYPVEALHMDQISVPGDFSSAAFFIVAALLVPGSALTIENVGLNPSRTGLLEVLARMGAEIEVRLTDILGPEPIGTIRVVSSELRGTEVRPEEVPNVIDELPLFLLAAAAANGVSRLTGAAELRAKESDRLAVMATFLRSLDVNVDEYPDGSQVSGKARWTKGHMDAHGDHRMAMTAAVAGLVSEHGVSVDDTGCIDVSFPGFTSLLESVGGTWSPEIP